MKRSICVCVLLLLVISVWSFGPATQEAKALKIITLISPADSTKETNVTPTFEWQATGLETVTRFHIKVARNPELTDLIWEDFDIPGTARSVDYPDPGLPEEWEAYYWAMRAEIDADPVYWQDFTPTSTFFHTTAVVIEIPTNLPTIQEGIVWAAKGDTVLVRQGTYYENLRFYKDSLVVISDSLIKDGSIDTTVINRTIIDGDSLTRGPDNGSVVYFSPAVDSSSILMGFTIRGGTGTRIDVGLDTRVSGGGIFCDAGSTPEIAYNVITGNQVQHDGGGIYINSAAPNIFHNIISNNLAIEGSGGAIECRFSVEVPVSSSPSPGGRVEETLQESSTREPEGDADVKASPSVLKSRLKMREDEIKKSLNPKDATEVHPVKAPAAPAKVTENTPPVAVIEWYARKDTLIQRAKYLPGDTLFFDGTESYDPDSGEGDFVTRWQWWNVTYNDCWGFPNPLTPRSMNQIDTIPISEDSELGVIIQTYLEVWDTFDAVDTAFLDTMINVQHPPQADAGEDVRVRPGETATLDGSASCDVNFFEDLEYTWTQLSGPATATIEDSDWTQAYFVPEDDSYLGDYEFQLKVSDGVAEDYDTMRVKVTYNTPPVAVLKWYARKDTLIQRVKYLVGDTLFFDGTDSYDPDLGDSITYSFWKKSTNFWCFSELHPQPFRDLGVGLTQSLPIKLRTDGTDPREGLIRVYLIVQDTTGMEDQRFSDTVTISIQYPPHADAGEKVGVAPGDTAWLDGSASCDVNPSDVLEYTWTQISGHITVAIGDPNSAVAYFFPEDTSYLGQYDFELKVSDGMGVDYDSLVVAVSRPPVPVCDSHPVFKDTLVGFQPSSQTNYYNLLLDACASSDPDSAAGDSVARFYWEPQVLITPRSDGKYSELGFVTIPNPKDTLLCAQRHKEDFGGLAKYYLRVEDTHGVMSKGYDSVFISVQLPPVPIIERGDTVVRPEETVYLLGRAFDINPDQRDSLTYTWDWDSLPPVTEPLIKPSDTNDSINFIPQVSGYYSLLLTVADPYRKCYEPARTIVLVNQLPVAVVNPVDHAFEGDTVYLDGSASWDPDSATFQHPDSSELEFTWSVESSPHGVEEPVIIDSTLPIAKFVPYVGGTYKFRLLVNDNLSVKQPPEIDQNITTLLVTVDSTYAYPIIQGNLIYGNFAGSKGGAIDCNGSSPDIISNVFYKNQSQLSGGAVCARNASTPQIMSNVFFGNISSDSTGGAVADLGAKFAPSATRGFRKDMAIEENNFWDNLGGTLYQASGNISANIDTFPRFYDPDFGDFRYECGSPCLPDIGKLVFFPECVTADRLNMVALSLFQNPVATAAAHFIVNTDVPLKGYPVGYVTIGGNAPSPVYFSPIASKTFRGSFFFTASGSAEVSVFVSSLLERDTVAVNTLSVQLIGAGKTGKLVSVDGKVGVLFADGSVKEDIYATCISVSKDSRYDFEGDPEMEAFGEPYQLGPSISFDKYPTISFSLGHFDLEDKNKTLFSVYRYEDGEWNRLESYPDGDRVCAEAKTLGVFRLIYDPNAKPLTNIPQTYQLFQNYPNPFNPETQIKYDLPVSGNVTLSIYNVLGQRVRVLADGFQEAGHRSVIWDGKDNQGREAASGIYFYKIKAENYQKTKKMVLLK